MAEGMADGRADGVADGSGGGGGGANPLLDSENNKYEACPDRLK